MRTASEVGGFVFRAGLCPKKKSSFGGFFLLLCLALLLLLFFSSVFFLGGRGIFRLFRTRYVQRKLSNDASPFPAKERASMFIIMKVEIDRLLGVPPPPYSICKSSRMKGLRYTANL